MAVARHFVEGTRIQRVIAQKLVDSAVELIAAGACHDVDLPAACTTHLRRVAAGFHFEFLHGVWGNAQILRVEGRVCIGRAVEQEIVGVGPVPTDADRRRLTGAPIQRTGITHLGAVAHVRAWHGQSQIQQHAAVQRKLSNRIRLDDFAQARVRRLQDVGPTYDIHRCPLRTQREFYIQVHLLPHLETHFAP